MNYIKDIMAEDFQLTVDNTLKERRSDLLETLSELTRCSSRLQRSVIYSISRCGCIELSSGGTMTGKLCTRCASTIEQELGGMLFASAALASAFDISIYDSMVKEKRRLELIGDYLYT